MEENAENSPVLQQTPSKTLPKLRLFSFEEAPSPKNAARKHSNDSDIEDEIKDQIKMLEDSPSKRSGTRLLLLQPITKRFSSISAANSLRKSTNISPFLHENRETLFKFPENNGGFQRHSRKSVQDNLDDFLSNFSKNVYFSEAKEQVPVEKDDLQERLSANRRNLYEYLQYYLKMDLENDSDNENDGNFNNFNAIVDEEKEKLQQELNDIPALFKQKFKVSRDCGFLQVTKMNEIEKLKVDYRLYPDNLPFLFLRRNFLLFCKYISVFSKKIVLSKSFQLLSFLMILLNSLTYSLISNRSNKYEQYSSVIGLSHDFFLFFYLVEMALKIFSYGLLLHPYAYFRDGWNILDFVVIVTLLVTYTDVKSLDISLLRLLRLLKPMKSHASFGTFQIIISALFSALPLLCVAFAILIFFYLFYAIAGLQIFSGVLKQRCFQENTGLFFEDEYLCGNSRCPEEFSCAKLLENPYFGVISFDNVLLSLLQALLIVTLDNWTTIMYSVQKVMSNFAWVYFVSLVILGNYFLISLTLAVIKVKFSESHKNLTDALNVHRKSVKARTFIELSELKKEGTWDARKIQRKFKRNG